MSVREIVASYEFKCDGCGATETGTSNSRPKHWCDFHILRDAYDYQGCAVADGSVKLLLCPECAEPATKAVNAAIDERRSAFTKACGEQS